MEHAFGTRAVVVSSATSFRSDNVHVDGNAQGQTTDVCMADK
jgi:hypothetical protein